MTKSTDATSPMHWPRFAVWASNACAETGADVLKWTFGGPARETWRKAWRFYRATKRNNRPHGAYITFARAPNWMGTPHLRLP